MYYELLPYNYSFLSPDEKIQVHDHFRQLIAQNQDGKIHALQISTASSIRSVQERSKNLVTGRLKDVAYVISFKFKLHIVLVNSYREKTGLTNYRGASI